MHALQLVAPRTFAWKEVPDPPETPPPGHVVVKLETAAVCGSDMPYFTGETAEPYPQAIGRSIHECMGRVTASASPKFEVGEKVLALPFSQTGLQEYLVLPDERVFRMLPEAPPHHVLAQPLATVLWACRKLPGILGKDVAVLGQGPIGLLFDQWLSRAGARSIIGIDRVSERLQAARRMGATACVDASAADPVEAVAALTGGRMADVVVEAVGHQPHTVELAIDLAAQDGDILLFGVPSSGPYPFPMGRFFRKNLNLLASVHPDLERTFPLAIDMVNRGAIDVESLVTHRFPVSRIAEAFDLVERRADGVLKPLITFDW